LVTNDFFGSKICLRAACLDKKIFWLDHFENVF